MVLDAVTTDNPYNYNPYANGNLRTSYKTAVSDYRNTKSVVSDFKDNHPYVYQGIHDTTKNVVEKTKIKNISIEKIKDAVSKDPFKALPSLAYKSYSKVVPKVSEKVTQARAGLASRVMNSLDLFPGYGEECAKDVVDKSMLNGQVGGKLANKLTPEIVGKAVPVVGKLAGATAAVGLDTAIDLVKDDSTSKENQVEIGKSVVAGFAGVAAVAALGASGFLAPIAIGVGVALINSWAVNTFPVVKDAEAFVGKGVISGYRYAKNKVKKIGKSVVAGAKATYHKTMKGLHKAGKAVRAGATAAYKWANNLFGNAVSGRRAGRATRRFDHGHPKTSHHHKTSGSFGKRYGAAFASGAKVMVEEAVIGGTITALNGVRNDLNTIKRENDTIIPEMSAGLKQVENELNSIFPIDMSGEIESAVSSHGLRPQQYADVSAIRSVDQEIIKQESSINNIINGVRKTVNNQTALDNEWSGRFRLG